MLTLRKLLKTAFLSAAICLLTIGTAAGKNERAAQRQAQNQQRIAERQAAVAEKRAGNQTRAEANRQAAADQRSERQAAAGQRRAERETAAAQRQAANQARAEANRQAAAERSAERQAAAEQRRTGRQTVAAQRQAQNQARLEADRQAAERRAETITAANPDRRNITRDVRREVDTRRNVTDGGTQVVSERSDRPATTISRRSFAGNVGTRPWRDGTNRFDRPHAARVVYPHRDGSRSSRIHWRGFVHGRRPGSIFTHVVWPSYGYPVYYRHGPDLFVHYLRPSFHRKYVFFCIGNFWPVRYTYVRYYWYGWHPYYWYGSYPTAYETAGDTYNYYTYNTYNYESDASQTYASTEYTPPLEGVDETTFADIRQKLAEQSQQQPGEATLTDNFFENGVTTFEQGDYETAAKAFADAIALEPNDVILPFAYVQALFASEQYSKAADILRLALQQMPADQQGLFFPRGLYSDDEVFFAQIEQLRTRTDSFSYDPDLSLLLAYQLIGAEKYDEARSRLEQAGQYEVNQNAVTTLFDLLNKLEEQPQSVPENT